MPAPEVIAERLDLPEDDNTVVRRENWYFADDEPVQVGITYIPWAIAEGTVLATSANMGKGSLYGRFEDRGHRITWIREEIGSRMPTPGETERLAIPAGIPSSTSSTPASTRTRSPSRSPRSPCAPT